MRGLQQRHFDYVLGPNQDSRLASVAAGSVITGIKLIMQDDAAFVLTGRAVRCAYAGLTSQGDLQGLASRWAGPDLDFRHDGYLLESLQMAYFGQYGCPKPISPGIVYPPRSVLRLDLYHSGAHAITNLTFYWRGFKLYPQGAVPAYTYPNKCAVQPFSYPVAVSQLGYNETRLGQVWSCKQDADFVLRGGSGIALSTGEVGVPGVWATVLAVRDTFLILRDQEKKPYSNDFVPFDVLFGMDGAFGSGLTNIPLGASPAFTQALGCGTSAPGLFYPEIYVPRNHQLLYDLQRNCLTGSRAAQDLTFALAGAKVFER